jgi:NAD(P)-dependent dehydrogenase (short-subunit alcohol dehydrogenase family)
VLSWRQQEAATTPPRPTEQTKGVLRMSSPKIWFITDAGRGMGVDIARSALAGGHAVVATGRNTEAVRDALGDEENLLVVELDITSLASAEAAVRAALERFGRVDVLVNNAGNFTPVSSRSSRPSRSSGSCSPT